MKVWPRRALAGVVAALFLGPAASAQAMHLSASNAVLLRYHFTAGESYAYHMAVDMKMSMDGLTSAGAASAATVTEVGLMRFHILSVDASGGAQAEMSVTNLSMHTTVGGQTVSEPAPAQAPMRVYLGADGSQSMVGASGNPGSFAFQTLGVFPRGAVAPGARWTTTGAVNLPSSLGLSLGPIRASAHNTFDGYATADHMRAAAIRSAGSVSMISDSAYQGAKVHMHIAESVSGQTMWGVALGRVITTSAHVDLRLFMTAPGASGASQSVHMHVMMAVGLQPAGW